MRTLNYFIVINLLLLAQNPLCAEEESALNTLKPGPASLESAPVILSDEDFIAIRNPFLAETASEETLPPATGPDTAPAPTTDAAIPSSTPAMAVVPAVKIKKDIKPQILKLPALNVSGLVWNTDKPQAIINNKIISVGDTVEEAKILRITGSGITMRYHDKEITIILEK